MDYLSYNSLVTGDCIAITHVSWNDHEFDYSNAHLAPYYGLSNLDKLFADLKKMIVEYDGSDFIPFSKGDWHFSINGDRIIIEYPSAYDNDDGSETMNVVELYYKMVVEPDGSFQNALSDAFEEYGQEDVRYYDDTEDDVEF